MNNKIKLTTADICGALDVKKHRLRAWTACLSPYCDQPATARVARKYAVQDLLFFATIRTLEDKYGVGIAKLQKWAPRLHELFGAPLSRLHGQFLVFSANGTVGFLPAGTALTPGLTIELDEIREPIESYLDVSEPVQQREFPLPLLRIK